MIKQIGEFYAFPDISKKKRCGYHQRLTSKKHFKNFSDRETLIFKQGE